MVEKYFVDCYDKLMVIDPHQSQETTSVFRNWYCAMRWPYVNAPTEAELYEAKAWWHNKKILVTNPKNGKQVVLAAKDWGPAEWTGRVIDVSKTALDVLGAKTDDVVNIAFADQNTRLGPVENDVIIYEICYDNTKNDIDVHNVKIIDTLLAEVSFISTITRGGTYAPSTHTVTWDIGTLSAWATQQCVHLVVRVSSTVAQGSTTVNYATIDSDETLPTTISESTDVCPLPDEIGLEVVVTATPESCNVSETIEFEVTVTNLADIAGADLTAYYVKLSVIEPEEIEIDVPPGGMDIAKILPGESKSTTFDGKAVKAGDNIEVIVNAWGYTDLSDEVGKIRGRDSCTITIRDPEAPKPGWSFAIIADLHIGYAIPNYAPNYPTKEGFEWLDNLTGSPDEDYYITKYLENAVDKTITERGPYNITFVVVLGDFADTAEKSEFLKAREILNRLNDPNGDGDTSDGIPYIPVIGDHDQWPYTQKERADGGVNPSPDDRPESVKEKADFACGDIFFNEVFWSEDNNQNLELIEERLGTRLEKVDSVSISGRILPAYLQNRAFSYGNINFACLDFNPRITPPDADWRRIAEDIGRDYGGALIAAPHQETMNFLKGFLMDNRGKRTIIFTHHPLWKRGGFLFPGDIAKIIYDNKCHGKTYNFGGHTHRNWPKPGEVGGHIVYARPGPIGFPVLPAYEVIETEAVSQIPCEFPEWLPEEWTYAELTGNVVRIVKITGDEVDYSTVLKPKKVEIRWPFPDFAYGPWASYPEPNKEIIFTAHFTSYHGSRTSFDWDFGDGSYASSLWPSVTHIYSQDGEYNVTLTVTTKNLVTGEEKIYTVTRLVYVHTKHVISSLPSDLNVTSLITEEDLTQIPQNTYQPALITKEASEETPIAGFGVHFEEATEDVDLSSLVADVDIEGVRSIIYMPSWPEEIEDYKALFIPSTGAGTVYVCLDATSLDEVSLENADLIINVGETKEGMTVTTTFYNGREYYLLSGVTGTGGGEALTMPPVARVPTLTPIGLVALIGLLSIIAISKIRRRGK